MKPHKFYKGFFFLLAAVAVFVSQAFLDLIPAVAQFAHQYPLVVKGVCIGLPVLLLFFAFKNLFSAFAHVHMERFMVLGILLVVLAGSAWFLWYTDKISWATIKETVPYADNVPIDLIKQQGAQLFQKLKGLNL